MVFCDGLLLDLRYCLVDAWDGTILYGIVQYYREYRTRFVFSGRLLHILLHAIEYDNSVTTSLAILECDVFVLSTWE